jgi:hypothetical protein
MDQLEQILKEEVFKYAGGGFNLKMFPLANADQKVYAVNIIDAPLRKMGAGVVVLARIIEDFIIVEEDNTTKPLVEALMQRGIPRKQIILAYAGEGLPGGLATSQPWPPGQP